MEEIEIKKICATIEHKLRKFKNSCLFSKKEVKKMCVLKKFAEVKNII